MKRIKGVRTAGRGCLVLEIPLCLLMRWLRQAPRFISLDK